MDADFRERVTDSGLQALASAGCGAQLTSLTLQCELYCVIVVDVCSGSEEMNYHCE